MILPHTKCLATQMMIIGFYDWMKSTSFVGCNPIFVEEDWTEKNSNKLVSAESERGES